MGRLSASLLALALGALAAMALSSCGGSGGADLLPGSTAQEITENLDQVEQLASEGECIGAEDAAQQVSIQVEALGGVDQRLKQALEEGAARLTEVVATCEEEEEAETLTEAIEPAEEAEAEEKPEKPEKPKPEKPEKEEPEEAAEPPSLPPQANGEGKGLEEGEGPPAEPGEEGPPSGGVGPGEPAGSE